MVKTIIRAAGISGALIFISCQRDIIEPDPSTQRVFIPDHFPAPSFNFIPEDISEQQIQLGRKLFYDPILSSDSSISCASCHAQTHGFADHNKPLSHGVAGAVGFRNAPGLFNLAWHNSYMHDGGVNHLELVPLAPITEVAEMNLPIADALERLNKKQKYKLLFLDAYGSDSITTATLFNALTAFQLTLVSSSSKYDRVINGEDHFSPIEEMGYKIFTDNCSNCHQPPLFSDFSFANNGLDTSYNDAGRGRITQLPQDSGRFKVPSLRNLGFTYPYMHDGRFYNIREVIDHYLQLDSNLKDLDARIKPNETLSESEIQALIAFIETLNDYQLISDLRHSEPTN